MRPALFSGTVLFRNITRDPFVSPEPNTWVAPRRREDGMETKQNEDLVLPRAVTPPRRRTWKEERIPPLSPVPMSTPTVGSGIQWEDTSLSCSLSCRSTGGPRCVLFSALDEGPGSSQEQSMTFVFTRRMLTL